MKYMNIMKKITAMCMAMCLTVSVQGTFFADDIKDDENKEQVTEEQMTEETTQEDQTPQQVVDYSLVAGGGYSKELPKNSLPAIKEAIQRKYKEIKIDLRRCKPDEEGRAVWVAANNDFLNESMGANAKISQSTYKELLKYTYIIEQKDSEYDAESLRIVSLEEIIEMMQMCKNEMLDITWQFEIKISTDPQYDSYLEEIITLLKESQVEELAKFSSYDYTYVKKIKEIDQTIHTCFNSTRIDDSTLHYASLSSADEICFKANSTLHTPEQIGKAFEAGYELSVYNIEDIVLMGTYYRFGIRKFVTSSLEYENILNEELNRDYNVEELTFTLSQENYTYEGEETLPELTVSYNDCELFEGINYTLEYENTNVPGTANIKVTGINNCLGEKDVPYQIEVPNVANIQFTSLQATYAKFSWKKVSVASGYMIYHYNSSNKKYELVKSITDPETLTCKIKNLTPGIKHKFKIVTYVVLEGVQYDSQKLMEISGYTKPEKASMKSAVRYHKGERIKIKWKKVANCSGYQVKIAKNKKMTKLIGNYTLSGKSSTKKIVKKLSSKKTYYIKVRAYVKDGKDKKYGSYSEVLRSVGKN